MGMRIKKITVDYNFVETCKVNEFQCSDGNCIPIAKKCNYDIDCADRSDENICPTVITCPEVRSGKCVVHQLECSTTANFGNHTTPENRSDSGSHGRDIVVICLRRLCLPSVIILKLFY